MKKLLLHTFLFFSVGVSAQNFTLTGKVVDETGKALPGAHLTLLYPWGEDVKSTVTEANGKFKMEEVERGGYRLKATFVGYSELVGEVNLKDKNLDVGTLRLEPDATQLSEVEVTEKIPLATQDGDTTSFNADAFKVLKDASAEELVEKMPGVVIQDGKVQAQGEDVKQVLVDGRPFFGNDPTAALQNLPAEVIQKIQVYDQQSDQSQFTGFDDGNSSKTINIITRPDMRAGQFGKMYAGYGYENKYQAGGNINYFNGDQRISVIGLSNNVNVQNFATEDLLGVVGQTGGRGRGSMGGRGRGGGRPGGGQGRRGGGSSINDFLVQPQGGISTTHAFGLNYSDKWGEKWDVSGSYFFNQSNTDSEQRLTQQYVTENGFGEIYQEETFASSDNTNHRLNGRLVWEMDSMNSFIITPRLSMQINDGQSFTEGQTDFENAILNQTSNIYGSDLSALNFTNDLLWRHKFSKKGRTFSMHISGGYSPKSGDGQLQSEDAFFTLNAFDTLDQISTLDVNSWNAAASANYTEPLGENGQLMAEYRLSYQQEESEKEVFDFVEGSQTYDDLNESLSNVFSNDYVTHRTGLGYNYRLGRDLRLMARARFQHATLDNEQTFPQSLETGQTFQNILPMAMLRWNINGRVKNVRAGFFTSTQLPSVEQLQNVVDNSNPLQLEVGNPDLKQSVSSRVFARYQATNTEKSTVFYAMLSATFQKDYIGQATYFADSDHPIFAELNVQPGSQLSQPVNLDGYRNVRSFLTYGLPLEKLKSNLNIDLTWSQINSPGLLDEEENTAKTNSFGTGLTLSSNISDRVDFTLSARPSFNRVRNTLQSGGDSDYLSQTSRVKFNWIILDGFVIRTNLAHQMNRGLSDSFNQNFWLWNFGIGKKLFKNERGELTLSVNDLLNQNRNITRTVTETYIEDSQTNALTRYVMLTFTYNLRHFNTGKKASDKKEKERRPPGF